MIRLSRKGWNNVLIFSMLLMIVIFNGLHKKLRISEQPEQQVYLLPENSLVLTLTFGKVAIERIGQGWRSQPSTSLTETQLSELMLYWKNQTAQWQAEPTEAKLMTQGTEPDQYVIATLAGKDEGAVYAFYINLDQVWIHDQQQQRWLKTTALVFEQLIPQPLRL